MKDLHEILEEKLIEGEFENKESNLLVGELSLQELMDEQRQNDKKFKSYNAQVKLLEDRLRRIQKNYYDDMTIVDEKHKVVSPPWKSTSFARNKYAAWDISLEYLHIENQILEVAISKDSNDEQIKVLDNICKRIKILDNMADKLFFRNKHIRRVLRDKFNVV